MTDARIDELLDAIGSEKPGAVEKLLNSGLDINTFGTNSTRFNVLTQAAMKGDVNLIRKLRDHGAIFDYADSEGLTAMHFAAMSGECDSIRTLGELGATVDIESLQSFTPLMIAAAFGELDAIRTLIYGECPHVTWRMKKVTKNLSNS